MSGRPFQFDGEITNFKDMTDGFGNLVHPSKITTTCPDCGQGLDLSVSLPDPPFPVVEFNCPYCRPREATLTDPFNNPLDSGKIREHEFDPLLQKPNSEIKLEEQTSVADRIDTSHLVEESTEPTSPDDSELAVDKDLVDLLGGEEAAKESSEGSSSKQPKQSSSSKKSSKKPTKKSSAGSSSPKKAPKKTIKKAESNTANPESDASAQQQVRSDDGQTQSQDKFSDNFDDSDLTES